MFLLLNTSTSENSLAQHWSKFLLFLSFLPPHVTIFILPEEAALVSHVLSHILPHVWGLMMKLKSQELTHLFSLLCVLYKDVFASGHSSLPGPNGCKGDGSQQHENKEMVPLVTKKHRLQMTGRTDPSLYAIIYLPSVAILLLMEAAL